MSRNYRTEKYRADRPSKTFNDVALKIPKGKEATLRAVAHESQNVYIMRATFDDAELEDTVTFVSQSGGKGGDMVMELELSDGEPLWHLPVSKHHDAALYLQFAYKLEASDHKERDPEHVSKPVVANSKNGKEKVTTVSTKVLETSKSKHTTVTLTVEK